MSVASTSTLAVLVRFFFRTLPGILFIDIFRISSFTCFHVLSVSLRCCVGFVVFPLLFSRVLFDCCFHLGYISVAKYVLRRRRISQWLQDLEKSDLFRTIRVFLLMFWALYMEVSLLGIFRCFFFHGSLPSALPRAPPLFPGAPRPSPRVPPLAHLG